MGEWYYYHSEDISDKAFQRWNFHSQCCHLQTFRNNESVSSPLPLPKWCIIIKIMSLPFILNWFQISIIFTKIMVSCFSLQQGGIEIPPFCSENWGPHGNQGPLVSKTWGTCCRTLLVLQPITNKAIVCNIFNIILTLPMRYYVASAQRVKPNGRCNRASKKRKQHKSLKMQWGCWLLGNIPFLIPGRLRTICSSKSKCKPKEDARLERGLWVLTGI